MLINKIIKLSRFLIVITSLSLLIACNKNDQKSNIDFQKDSTTSKQEIYYTCPMHPQIVQDHMGQCPICAMDLVKKIKTPSKSSNVQEIYYTCPMHPQIVQDHMGQCPICGMDLVKKIRNSNEDQNASEIFKNRSQKLNIEDVTLSSSQIELLKIGTSIIEKHNMEKEISVFGILEYKESSQSIISARIKGRIEKLFINSTGLLVKKGQPLFELYSSDLITTQQELIDLSKNPSEIGNNKAFTSVKNRLLLWGITQSQINEIEKTKMIITNIPIISQNNGIVTKKSVVEGQYISEGMELFSLSDLGTLWMKARIYDFELKNIKVGQKLEINSDAYPAKSFIGNISFIYPEVDQNTRTIMIRSDIPNPNFLLKPGMYVNAKIIIKFSKGLAVPKSAVFSNGKEDIVWIQKDYGKFIPKQIKIGQEVQDPKNKEYYYQILEGLDENDIIVTSAGFLIDSEGRIKAASGSQN